MAQLKDLLVAGDSRFMGNIYGNLTGNADTATKWANAVNLIVDLGKTSALSLQGGEDTSNNLAIGLTGYLGVAQGGTGRYTLDSGKVLVGNGTNAVTFRAITNNTAANAAAQNTNLITSNTLYYALPELNGSKSYTSDSAYFAPTSAGTKDYVLTSSGTGAPTWISQSSLAAGMASTLSTTRYIDGVAFNGSADITHYGVCSTAAGTAAKTVTVGGTFTLVTGARITVKFTNNNTVANPTLKVNDTDAKPMYRYGTTAMSTDDDVSGWMAGAVMSLVYDGTGWIREFWDNDNSTYTITSVRCDTAAGTAAKVSSDAKNYVLTKHNTFELTLKTANSAASALTLNINSTGAKPIWINGSASSATNYNLPAGKYIVYYDGTNYHFRTDGLIPWNRSLQKVSIAGNDVYLGDTLTTATLSQSLGINGTLVTVAGNALALGGSVDATTLRTSLGLSNAMHFIGVATVAITDGSTTDPKISGYDFSKKQAGDVIIDSGSSREYVWSSANKWELLGGDSSYKTTQTAVSTPTASGNSSSFIKTITQNANGVITATAASLADLTINDTVYNGSTARTFNLKTKQSTTTQGSTLPSVITKISQNENGEITVTLGQLATLSINGKSYDASSTIDVGTIGVGYGGTGRTSLTQYGILLGNGGNGINALAPASTGQVLIAKGTSSNPAWTSTLLVDTDAGIKVSGYIMLNNSARFEYNSTDKCIDVIF